MRDYDKEINDLQLAIKKLQEEKAKIDAEEKAKKEAAKLEKKKKADVAIEKGVEMLLDGLAYYFDNEDLNKIFKKFLDPDIIVNTMRVSIKSDSEITKTADAFLDLINELIG